jgi:hypothetical protein
MKKQNFNPQKITEARAIEDFENWLDYKKIRDKKRSSFQDSEESIIAAIMDGSLVICEDFKIEYTLLFPITNDKGEITLEKIKLKPRIKAHEIESKMKGVKANDIDGRIRGYISALSGQNSAIIKKLDTEDYGILREIASYFL